MIKIGLLMLALLPTLFLSGCEQGAQQVASTAIPDEMAQDAAAVSPLKDADIHWFDGSIDAAFDEANVSGKPIFLYWGAVWCPPCQEIRHTVFKSQAFLDLSRLFVAVYLDGDTDRAQQWGERFAVRGYPTMIVFDAAGEELTRLPGGIDIDRYNSVLTLSLNAMKPTRELVNIARNDVSLLSADDLQQLAWYSWGQDFAALPEDIDAATLFLDLADNALDDVLEARFLMEYLLVISSLNEQPGESVDESTEAIIPQSTLTLGAMRQRLKKILQSDALILATWDTLAYRAEEILLLLEDDGSLGELWAGQVFRLRFDESLSRAEKLAGWLPALRQARLAQPMIPETLASQLRSEMQTVDRATTDPYERQSVINQMAYIYREANLLEDAKVLLTAELDQSKSPYYFMSSLAGLYEGQGAVAQALDWRRQAYESAQGQATRFQWGVSYVLAMIRLSPGSQEDINATALSLVTSFEVVGDLFTGRNLRSLERLDGELRQWEATGYKISPAYTRLVTDACGEQSVDSPGAQNCRELLDGQQPILQSVQR